MGKKNKRSNYKSGKKKINEKVRGQKDKVISVFLVISLVLCLGGVGLGIFAGAQIVDDYKLDNRFEVKVDKLSDITDLGESVYNDTLLLTTDLVINDPDFKIGSTERPFSGVFNGQGHTVYINYDDASSETTLFGCLGSSGVVKNTTFVFGDFTPKASSFGGIVAVNRGTIKDCRIAESTFECDIAGLVSPVTILNYGTIANVVVDVSVSFVGTLGDDFLYGGACVYNYGTVKNVVVDSTYDTAKTVKADVNKGTAYNHSISAVRVADNDNGRTESCLAVLDSASYVCDFGDGSIRFAETGSEVYVQNIIFVEHDFYNVYWEITEDGLKLKGGIK